MHRHRGTKARRAVRLASRVGELLAEERVLEGRAQEIRRALDRAILLARRTGVPHKEIAAAAISSLGLPPTELSMVLVANRLRQRAMVASARVRSADTRSIAAPSANGQDRAPKETDTMPEIDRSETLRHRRKIVIDEYFGPALDGDDKVDELEDGELEGEELCEAGGCDREG
ncbi:MAG: hypothetical protein V2A73_16815 [Pseudomonadota bacterium]